MTWTLKVRTSPGAPMVAEFECPDHGRFERLVPRDSAGDPPSESRCEANCLPVRGVYAPCGSVSPWRISSGAVHTQFAISATQGKSAPKPHKNTMDTRMIAEGQKNKFRAQRKQLRNEERHKRVKELLR